MQKEYITIENINLHSSMDRLETNEIENTITGVMKFTFQYG